MNQFVISNILAPTDLSDASIPALDYARLFAERFAASLTVMYSDPIFYPVEVMPPAGLFVGANPAEAKRLHAEVEQHVTPVMGARPFDVEVAFGQPIPAILSLAEQRHADLIVMGTHLRHGWRRALLGSVSEGVLHGSRCPVLTVAHDGRPAESGRRAVTRILCPINFTEVARNGLYVASRLAEAFSAQLVVVHAIEPDAYADVVADEEKVRRWIAPELQDICSFRQLVVRGGAAERVLACAEEVGCDLIVAGARHRKFRDTTVVGATTERLMRFSSCPILVVPHEGARRSSGVEKKEPELLASAVS